MNVLTIFGSGSDERVYKPLGDDLGHFFQTEHRTLSAHRNPKELGELIAEDRYDLYVAGAGLSAHLPGVIASLTPRAVVGIPVDAVFAGLDSLFSILHMPFPVPVLAFGPGNIRAVAPFLQDLAGVVPSGGIEVVVRDDCRRLKRTSVELQRLEQEASKRDIQWHLVDSPSGARLAVNFVAKREDVVPLRAFNVAVFDARDADDYRKSLDLFDWVESGGAWMGTNNARNALVWWNKFISKGRRR